MTIALTKCYKISGKVSTDSNNTVVTKPGDTPWIYNFTAWISELLL